MKHFALSGCAFLRSIKTGSSYMCSQGLHWIVGLCVTFFKVAAGPSVRCMRWGATGERLQTLNQLARGEKNQFRSAQECWVAGGAHKTPKGNGERKEIFAEGASKNGAFVKSSIFAHNAGGALCLKFCFEYCSNTRRAEQFKEQRTKCSFFFIAQTFAGKINIPLLLGDRHSIGQQEHHQHVPGCSFLFLIFLPLFLQKCLSLIFTFSRRAPGWELKI